MKYLTKILARFKRWILSIVISRCNNKDKHIWIKKGLERKCIICKKEQYNMVRIVNKIGKKHGGHFYLKDNWI